VVRLALTAIGSLVWSNKQRPIKKGGELALDGCHYVTTHNNQPRVDDRGRQDVVEEAQQGRSVCGGASSRCLGALSGRTKK
jgi:hypothetical protein